MEVSRGDKVTVITICFNAEKTIEKTMRSVLEQTYSNIQYIIKDGNSKDKTNEIVERYKDEFEKKNIEFLHIIKNDNGIYDAMNQATKQATGKWINYMNSDDIFVDNNVLKDCFADKSYEAAVLYGDSVNEYEFIHGKREYSLWKGQDDDMQAMPFSHQATFFNSDKIKNDLYDSHLRSAADYNLLLYYKSKGDIFSYLNRVISLCTMDGFSNINIEKSYKESNDAKRKNGFKYDNKFKVMINLTIFKIRKLMFSLLSEETMGKFIRKRRIKSGMKLVSDYHELF